MKRRRVLVTGGAGFIGSHTIDWLLEQGRQVIVLDNLSSGKSDYLPLKHPDLEFIEGDVLEYPLVLDLMRGVDAVLHLAAVASVPMSIDHPAFTLQVNTLGFLHVLEAVRHAGHPIRLVYASSAAVYGNASALPCRDDAPLTAQPLSPYALQKLSCEQYANLYALLHGVKSMGMRYFNVYGLRQDPRSPYSGVISRFLEAYHQRVPMRIYGDGGQSRDFIHVADVARANLLALDSDEVGVMNIATGEPQTLLQLIEYLEAAGKHPAKKQLEPVRPGDIRTSYADIRQAEARLGFRFSLPLKEGMAQLFQV